MDWIRVDAAASRSPKIRKLAKRLGVTRHQAAGIVLDLWSWTALSRETGDLNGIDHEDLAIACDWDGDPDALVKALVGVKILDRSGSGLSVHDWMTYQGRVFDHRERNKAYRERSSGHSVISRGRHADDSMTSPCPPQTGSQTDRQTDIRADARDPEVVRSLIASAKAAGDAPRVRQFTAVLAELEASR